MPVPRLALTFSLQSTQKTVDVSPGTLPKFQPECECEYECECDCVRVYARARTLLHHFADIFVGNTGIHPCAGLVFGRQLHCWSPHVSCCSVTVYINVSNNCDDDIDDDDGCAD